MAKEEASEKEIYIRNIQLEIKQKFGSGDLMEFFERTTGYRKPFPVDPVLMNRAEGQRELMLTIKNYVSMSPDEIVKKLL